MTTFMRCEQRRIGVAEVAGSPQDAGISETP